MKSYFLKRLLLFIPGLLLMSLLVFGLSKLAPGNPIDQLIEEFPEKSSADAHEKFLAQQQAIKKKYHLDKANFYFSIRAKSRLENYIELKDQKALNALNKLALETGNGELLALFYAKIAGPEVGSSPKDREILQALPYSSSLEALKTKLVQLSDSPLKSELIKDFEAISEDKNTINKYLPSMKWNGLQNQYHIWLSAILRADFGKSYYDGKSVTEKISEALSWTLGLSLTALLLAFLIAIPCGVYAAANEGSLFDRSCTVLFFGLHALPSFWLATLLIVFFTNPDYLSLFPSYGIGDISQAESTMEILQIRMAHLILPLFCWTYGSLAYIFRQIRKSMIHELNTDYIQTALSKGLSKREILWKHAFKNASFPLITILGAALPQVISGAFVVEYIFSIPGMGILSINALSARDYPVLFGILLLIAFVTMLGLLLSDILYHRLDPRLNVKQA